MSDLIDRQTAYKVLTEYYHHKHLSQHIALKEALDKVPSAEPQRWIPVSERLPNDGDDVLITFCGEEETRIVLVNYYQKIWFDCIFDIELASKKVTAWMPLPEPWKGESDG